MKSLHKRTKNLGHIQGLSRKFSKKISLEVFKRMCISRNFELKVKKAYEEKSVKVPIYLSLGQESVSAAVSVAFPKPYIFAQYRSHDIYLAYGGDPLALADELLSKSSGCSGGMGGSVGIQAPEIGMFGHNGLVGDQVPIAVGFALGTNKKTLAVLGDGAAEEDYVLGALGYAVQRKLPMLFVCFDNNLSILTEVKIRRSWKIAEVARGFGMDAVDIADDPWVIMHHIQKLQKKLPALINVHTVRHLWHTGTGIDGPPEWNRYEMVRGELLRLGYERDVVRIEKAAEVSTTAIWDHALRGLK
ncbi:MAG: thiamine pyrophosphate-dependent enzyme [bacterium]|nr:thiamine pyrophosphate-dependent enzyme [bacterium]